MYPLGGPSAIGPELGRSTLDLLSQPFAFSQTGVLDEMQFITEAKKRGLELDVVPCQVGDSAGGWSTDGGVVTVMVVAVQEAVKGSAAADF